MKRSQQQVSLGDLVVAAYDAAGGMSDDERDASYLAACAIHELLMDAGRDDLARELAEPTN